MAKTPPHPLAPHKRLGAGLPGARLFRAAVWLGILGISTLFMACSFVPREGPLAIEIERQSETNEYVVVDVDAGVVHTLGQMSHAGLQNRFVRRTKAPRSTIGVGDQLAITIWEAGEGGLFSNQTSKSASFPSVVVDRKGTISLPYAGISKRPAKHRRSSKNTSSSGLM